MSRVARLVLVLGFLLALLPTSALAQTPLPPNCELRPQSSGSVWLVCTPSVPSNGDLVVFAHGYVAPGEPITAGFSQLIVDPTTVPPTTIPGLITSMGYTFAASSYPKNGLAVKEGLADTKAMVDSLQKTLHAEHVYLVGASEGGLVTTLGVERYPGTFDGGLSTCGPIGDFRGQINYFGDFRVVFDYFFPDVLPGSPVDVPSNLMAGWDTIYSNAVVAAMVNDPTASSQLLKVTRAAVDPGDPTTAVKTALSVLWYNVRSTNEAKVELGGQPFDNRYRIYFGSLNDRLLNLGVERFTASPKALRSIAASYQTSGRLRVPLITMHNTLDPVVPYWHEPLYTAKTLLTGSAKMHVNIPVTGYGHCVFDKEETLVAFGMMVYRVTGQPPAGVQSALPNAASRAKFAEFAAKIGLPK